MVGLLKGWNMKRFNPPSTIYGHEIYHPPYQPVQPEQTGAFRNEPGVNGVRPGLTVKGWA